MNQQQQQPTRVLPHNIEAEQALLGAIFLNNDAYHRVSDFLNPEHFYEGIHQKIYEVTRGLIRAGKAATPVSLKTFIDPNADLGGITVGQYLARLAAEATTIVNAIDYGWTIRDLYTRRSLISMASDIANDAFDSPVDLKPSQLVEQIEQQLYALSESNTSSDFAPFESALTAAIERASQAYQRDGALAGLSTGIPDLDRMMGGMQASDLIILAGRPGMGKTSLATNIAFNVASSWRGETSPDGQVITRAGARVGFFSLEMSSEQLATRIISERVGIASSIIRRGSFNEPDFTSLAETATELRGLPLFIDQSGGLSIAQLTSRARRLKRRRGIDLLIVDYLQLMRGSGRKSQENRVQEITEITSGLKALAKELNVPVLALSQLNRSVESRDDKRPHLADLRESGSIEQDADVVMFVYREEYYHLMKKPSESNGEKFATWMADADKLHGKAEVIIGKQRHGPTGTIELQFDANLTRFSSLARTGHLPDRIA